MAHPNIGARQGDPSRDATARSAPAYRLCQSVNVIQKVILMKTVTPKLSFAVAALLATLAGPVLAESNINTTIQEGRINTNVTDQRGRVNDNATYQEGQDNANRTWQRGEENWNQTGQFGRFNYNETHQQGRLDRTSMKHRSSDN
jgi:minor curlin subunit